MSKAQRDVLARAGWTILQVAVAALVVVLADVPAWWAVPIATALSAAKSIIATKVGDPETATFA